MAILDQFIWEGFGGGAGSKDGGKQEAAAIFFKLGKK